MAESQWGWRGDGLMVGWGWLSGGILFVLARSDSDGFLEERIGGNVKIRKKKIEIADCPKIDRMVWNLRETVN